MGKKVFVSYKYADSLVRPMTPFGPSTCREYVDHLAQLIQGMHIYKGEEDGNDLSALKHDTIETKLKEKIRDSSVTIVMISKGMKTTEAESEQWIPWEISYSLKEHAREDRVSRTNGVLAVIIPDENGSYDHYYQHSGCSFCGVVTHKTAELFEILRNNMFNRKVPNKQACALPNHQTTFHTGNDHSYIYQVKWDDFIKNPTSYIDHAAALSTRVDEYDIQKIVQKQAIVPPQYQSLADLLGQGAY